MDQQSHDRLVYLSKKILDLLPVSRIQKGQFITSQNLVWKKNVAFWLIFFIFYKVKIVFFHNLGQKWGSRPRSQVLGQNYPYTPWEWSSLPQNWNNLPEIKTEIAYFAATGVNLGGWACTDEKIVRKVVGAILGARYCRAKIR